MATIYEIAKKAGVSRDTAARILRGECKEERRDAVRRAGLVMDIARSIGYRPNAAAKAVSSGRFNSITLMEDHDIRMHYLPSALLDSIGISLSQKGIRLTFSSFAEKSHSSSSLDESLFHEKHCDGYLINYLKPVSEDFLTWARNHDIKCAWLNNRTGSHCVHMDDRRAGYDSSKLLSDKAALASKIAGERFSRLPEIPPAKELKVAWHPRPANWQFSDGCSLNRTDGGAVMLLKNDDMSKAPVAIGTYRVSDQVATVKISAVVKLADVVVGQNPSEQPRIFVDFCDSAGKNVGGFPSMNPAWQNSDSQRVFESFVKPAGAVTVAICPQLLHCKGSLEISELVISSSQ